VVHKIKHPCKVVEEEEEAEEEEEEEEKSLWLNCVLSYLLNAVKQNINY